MFKCKTKVLLMSKNWGIGERKAQGLAGPLPTGHQAQPRSGPKCAWNNRLTHILIGMYLFL